MRFNDSLKDCQGFDDDIGHRRGKARAAEIEMHQVLVVFYHLLEQHSEAKSS